MMKRLINQELAERFISVASLSGLIYGIAGLQNLSTMMDILDLIFYINLLGFILGCAYGIYRKSRSFAVILFTFYLLDRINIWYTTNNLSVFFNYASMIFIGAFLCGIVATFSYHNLIKQKARIGSILLLLMLLPSLSYATCFTGK
ncbi:MAG: hypothetical protein MPW16_13625 [Candidatus Manganitrophus sp.]|nr:MAG: hypothetical protein MPW16_13625 [Candidatus Manganitrophus sp.]